MILRRDWSLIGKRSSGIRDDMNALPQSVGDVRVTKDEMDDWSEALCESCKEWSHIEAHFCSYSLFVAIGHPNGTNKYCLHDVSVKADLKMAAQNLGIRWSELSNRLETKFQLPNISFRGRRFDRTKLGQGCQTKNESVKLLPFLSEADINFLQISRHSYLIFHIRLMFEESQLVTVASHA